MVGWSEKEPKQGPNQEPNQEQAAFTEGTHCLRCGYSLRQVPLSGACPECGMEAARWVRADRLDRTPEGWRRGLQHGAWMLQCGIALALILPHGGALLAAYGIFWLTRPAPGDSGFWPDVYVRRLARGLLAVGLTALMVMLPWLIRAWWRGRLPVLGQMKIWDAALIAAHTLAAFGFIAAFRYVYRLACRIPDGTLARHSLHLRNIWLAGLMGIGLLGVTVNFLNSQWSWIETHLPQAARWSPAVLFLAAGAILLGIWWESLRWAAHLNRRLKMALPPAVDVAVEG